MAHILFYEKPGCQGNLRQKTALIAAGHEVEARDLRTEAWTTPRLMEFLALLPITEWFNPHAPAVRDGKIQPATLQAEDALSLISQNPLLLRRPLLECAGTRMVGFDLETLKTCLGIDLSGLPESERGGLQGCSHGNDSHSDDHGHCGRHG